MTEPLTFLDPALIETLRPGCDNTSHDDPAQWIWTWRLPCDHPDAYLLCDPCCNVMRDLAARYANEWRCPVCHRSGRLVSLVRL